MSEETEILPFEGLVIYADGSFREGRAGWGIHAYTFLKTPLKQGTGNKQVPTDKGYEIVDLGVTVTPVQYFDGFGNVLVDPTNNTGELQAAIEAFRLAEKLKATSIVIRSDSEYVQKNLQNQVKTWIKNGWLKADGNPVANRGYWETLVSLRDNWVEAGNEVDFRWVKGHSGELGNDIVDANAKLGSGAPGPDVMTVTPAKGYHNPSTDISPLFLKTRALFSFGPDAIPSENYYHLYQLGRMHTYGQKQQDSVKEKMAKTDLIYGRRISEATFSVVKLNQPEPYIEKLKNVHTSAFNGPNTELGIIRLDNATRPSIYQRIQQLGGRALNTLSDINVLATPSMDMISKTLSPPRMAREGVAMFTCLQSRLDDYLKGELGAAVKSIEITSAFYGEETSGKKTQTKLHKAITPTTPLIEIDAVVNGVGVKLRLVLGIDIPQRNQLAKFAELEPKVTVLLVSEGPVAYSYCTVFETTEGTAIFQSPYTKFILPK